VLSAHCLLKLGLLTRQHVGHPTHDDAGLPLMQHPLAAQVAPLTQPLAATGVHGDGSDWPMGVLAVTEAAAARRQRKSARMSCAVRDPYDCFGLMSKLLKCRGFLFGCSGSSWLASSCSWALASRHCGFGFGPFTATGRAHLQLPLCLSWRSVRGRLSHLCCWRFRQSRGRYAGRTMPTQSTNH